MKYTRKHRKNMKTKQTKRNKIKKNKQKAGFLGITKPFTGIVTSTKNVNTSTKTPVKQFSAIAYYETYIINRWKSTRGCTKKQKPFSDVYIMNTISKDYKYCGDIYQYNIFDDTINIFNYNNNNNTNLENITCQLCKLKIFNGNPTEEHPEGKYSNIYTFAKIDEPVVKGNSYDDHQNISRLESWIDGHCNKTITSTVTIDLEMNDKFKDEEICLSIGSKKLINNKQFTKDYLKKLSDDSDLNLPDQLKTYKTDLEEYNFVKAVYLRMKHNYNKKYIEHPLSPNRDINKNIKPERIPRYEKYIEQQNSNTEPPTESMPSTEPIPPPPTKPIPPTEPIKDYDFIFIKVQNLYK